MNKENMINAEIVAQHRKAFSVIGSTMGAQFFQAETRTCWPKFEEDSIAAKADKLSIMLSREPKRYRLTGHDILGVTTGKDALGAPKIFLNEGLKDEVAIPVGVNMESIGAVVNDALNKALHGDQNIIFNDAEKLAATLNQYNVDERTRLEDIREKIDKMIDSINQTIAANNKKVVDYRRELIASAENIPAVSNGGVILVKHESEEE